DGDAESLLRAIPAIKEELGLNVELAAPHHFIPELPGWRERSRFVAAEGGLSFYHYDPYAQALSKIERGHAQDVKDVAMMFEKGLVVADELLRLYAAIEPQLYRYPAIDPKSLRGKVEATVEKRASNR